MTLIVRETFYMTSPTKAPRRTKAQIEALCDAMFELIKAERPTTVRHMFYRLVGAGHIRKTEGEYKSTVCRLLAEMRRVGRIPYGWITDNTRWRMKPQSYSSLQDALEMTKDTYRRALWDAQPAYLEIWSEKDAIASILYDVTSEWDVPLMTTRGYSSLSFLHSVGEDLKYIHKPCYLYYFGDHDPSGQDARRFTEQTIREMAPKADVHFELAAVTPEQIEQWDLPTRPTKKTDTRAKGFVGESVEVDAISPDRLRQLVSDCIEQHINPVALKKTRRAERAEQDTLDSMLLHYARA